MPHRYTGQPQVHSRVVDSTLPDKVIRKHSIGTSVHQWPQPAVPGGGADCTGGFEDPGTTADRQKSPQPGAIPGRAIHVNRGGENMQKTEFIRQINELVPRPDPVTTEALYRFDRECAETE